MSLGLNRVNFTGKQVCPGNRRNDVSISCRGVLESFLLSLIVMENYVLISIL